MAEQRLVQLIDDLDGSEAEEKVTFSLEGTSYEVDLSTRNAEKLRKAMAPYVQAARRTSGPSPAGRRRRRTTGRARAGRARAGQTDPRAVRVWAAENGIEVSPRGRIPAAVLDQYRQATGG